MRESCQQDPELSRGLLGTLQKGELSNPIQGLLSSGAGCLRVGGRPKLGEPCTGTQRPHAQPVVSPDSDPGGPNVWSSVRVTLLHEAKPSPPSFHTPGQSSTPSYLGTWCQRTGETSRVSGRSLSNIWRSRSRDRHAKTRTKDSGAMA